MSVSYILSDYMSLATESAVYDKNEDGTYSGRIPDFPGVVAYGSTLRDCENRLRSTFEDWILVGFKLGHPLPVIGNINLNLEPQCENLESM